MSATLTTAEDDIYALLKTTWDSEPDSTGIALLYANTRLAQAPPDADLSWAVAEVRPGQDRQTAFKDVNALHTHDGHVIVQIRVPIGKGLKQAKKLAQVVLKAFRGVRTTNGVVFYETRLFQNGIVGGSYSLDTMTRYEYTERV